MNPGSVQGIEHNTWIGSQRIFLWEKPAVTAPACGTILFIHGSNSSALPLFDLRVPERPESSAMDWFAARGFDTWCFDCRGYGRSYKGPEFRATFAEGAADAAAASAYIMAERKSDPLLVFGCSGGAQRAGLFAQQHPERIRALALNGFAWTGRRSRTLEKRRANLALWQTGVRRPITREFMRSAIDRDRIDMGVDTGVRACEAAFVEQVMAYDDSMPNSPYLESCVALPIVDPTRIMVPTLVMEGEFDGLTTVEDSAAFIAALNCPVKELTFMKGMAHATFLQKNLLTAYHVLLGFFTRPDLGSAG